MEKITAEYYLQGCNNYQVQKYLLLTENKIQKYNNIMVSVSGGSDSDILIDMFSKFDDEKKVKYVFFDTGLEYQATKKHLDYLEHKYDIKIIREKAIKSIPLSCKEYGQPFMSKFISGQISILQRHNFKWEDKSFDELIKDYPKIKSSVKWWCNQYKYDNTDIKRTPSFNIEYKKYLKEFLILNPPTFKIDKKCCKYAKKDLAKRFIKENNIELNVTGVRKAEGGVRSTSYKSCFDVGSNGVDNYRPLFFFSNQDKQYYKEFFNVTYSECYEVWGFKRTGCAGCPYNLKIEDDLKLVEQYEPKLHKGINNVFKDSYEYTKSFYDFRTEMKLKEKNKKGE